MKISRDSEWFASGVIILGVVVFLALIIGVIFWVRPPLQNLSRSQQPLYAFDSKAATVQVGEVRLSVPQNHVREIKKIKGTTESILMHALLPEFQSYSQKNWWLFESKSPSARMILIQIEQMKAMLSEQTKFKFLRENQLEKMTEPTAPLGLTHYLYKSPPKRRDQDIFTGFDSENHRLIYFCFRPTPLSVAPHCSRTFSIALDTALTYKFKRHHLNNWREIEANIKKFIRKIHLLSLKEKQHYATKKDFFQ